MGVGCRSEERCGAGGKVEGECGGEAEAAVADAEGVCEAVFEVVGAGIEPSEGGGTERREEAGEGGIGTGEGRGEGDAGRGEEIRREVAATCGEVLREVAEDIDELEGFAEADAG